jgi:hypothetical protein
MDKYSWFSIKCEGNIVLVKMNRYLEKFIRDRIDCFFIIEPYNHIDENSYWKIHPYGSYHKEIEQEYYFVANHCEIQREPDRILKFNYENRMILVEKPQEDEWLRLHLLRLIRVILRFEFCQNGALFFHAGMINFFGKGICFLGERKAGKTTTILNFLKRKEASFISNDDLSIEVEGSDIVGRGWPRSISIRKDTLPYINELKLEGNEFNHPANREGMANNFLYVQELTNLFECGLVNKCRVDLLVFPEFCNKVESKLVRLSNVEVKNLLLSNLLKRINKYAEFFSPVYGETVQSKNLALIDSLSENVKGFRLLQNIESLNESYDLILSLLNSQDR